MFREQQGHRRHNEAQLDRQSPAGHPSLLPKLRDPEEASARSQVQGPRHHHGQAQEQDELHQLADGADDGALSETGTGKEKQYSTHEDVSAEIADHLEILQR